MAIDTVKRIVFGRAIATNKAEHQLLPKTLALPVFSSDPLSSVAYATEEMMLVLVIAGAAALNLMLPIGFAIAALLVIVVTSYRQTVRAYPRGGGSYIVSKENLGTIPGLIAAAAILIDYVLTVAVSVTAGTVAITSAAPALADHRVPLALGLVALVTLANLRGVKEAGTLFAVPTYGFVVIVYVTLATGFIRCLGSCPVAETANVHLEAEAGLTLFLILRAFASGATALTGVEAIADGVQAFRRPQSKNAATTLAFMGAMSVSMFLGITFLARLFHVRVSEHLEEARSVLAQIGHAAFGGGFMFFVLQGFTAGILILAANTAYQDFPRLSAILARDRFMPSQFRNRGDRLVFTFGVLVLAVGASGLVVAFGANLTSLIQLYVVGVFTAFTLSQAGMVRRWLRVRGEGWRRSMVINAIGAATTGLVLVIVAITKFGRPPAPGAWIVIAAMPVIVLFFLGVSRHYVTVSRALRARGLAVTSDIQNTFVFLVPDLGLATADAIGYLRAVRPEKVIPLYTGKPESFEDVARRWRDVAPRFGDLQVLPNAHKRLTPALRRYFRAMPRSESEFLTVVMPETVRRTSIVRHLISNPKEVWLKFSLLFRKDFRDVVVANVPLLPEEHAIAREDADRPLEPERHVVLVLVSGVHDATVRAINYAKSIHPAAIEAVFFAQEPEETEPIVRDWSDPLRRIDVPLSVVDAPFRDFVPPLLEEVHKHSRRRDTVVTVVLPEFVVRHLWELALHNRTAFLVKRKLLFEPHVVVTSVPYRV